MQTLTQSEVADLLKIQPDTLRKWCRARRIPHIRISRTLTIFDAKEIDAWIEKRHVAASPFTKNSPVSPDNYRSGATRTGAKAETEPGSKESAA